jgi:hypothetical protein
VFDTHPSDSDRVRAAERARSAGIMNGGDVPAMLLFRDFESLSAAATRHHYEHDLGLDLATTTLMATDRAVQASRDRESQQQSAEAFFGERLSVLRPLAIRVDELHASSDQALVAELCRARQAMESSDKRLAEKYRLFESLQVTVWQSSCAEELLQAGFAAFDPEGFDLPEGTLQAAEAAAKSAIEQQADLEPILTKFEAAAMQRLGCACALGDRAAVQDRLNPDRPRIGGIVAETASLAAALNALAAVSPLLNELRSLSRIMDVLLANLAQSPNPEQLHARVQLAASRIGTTYRRIRETLGDIRSPDPESGTVTLAACLGLQESDATGVNPARVLDGADLMRLAIIGRLAGIAQQVEAAVDNPTA